MAVSLRPTPWYRTITRAQWRVLIAAKLGWMLDAMDFLLYVMAIGRLKTAFGFDDATAGTIGGDVMGRSQRAVKIVIIYPDTAKSSRRRRPPKLPFSWRPTHTDFASCRSLAEARFCRHHPCAKWFHRSQ